MKFITPLLLCFFIFGFLFCQSSSPDSIAQKTSQLAPITKHLKVPLYGQITDEWCWAACTQMILGYLGDSIQQCAEADTLFRRNDCCTDTAARMDSTKCRQTGNPQFGKFGYNITINAKPLTKEEIITQIDNNKPFGFSWGWLNAEGKETGGGHLMVGTGYQRTSDGEFHLFVNNPWPSVGTPNNPHGGDAQFITYDEYVSSPTHVFWNNWYNPSKKSSQTIYAE